MNALLAQLAAPFKPEHITWKPGSITNDKTKCMALAYADLRAYMERLDEVVGLDWTVEYQPWGDNRIIARLTIGGATRSSTGEYDAQDLSNNIAGTVAEAQAFKRAAAMFGLGRYLYDLPNAWVEFDPQRKRITESGLAKLDSNYKAWYARNAAPVATPKPAVEAAPVAERVRGTSKTGKPLTPQQELWGAGEAVFGTDWDIARPWIISKWTAKATPDNMRNSSSELSNDEKDSLSDYMNENATVLQRVWAKHKAPEVEPLSVFGRQNIVVAELAT